MPHQQRTRIAVRWRDLDGLGHLNQAVYHEYLEEGRAALLIGSGTGMFVLARVELDYRTEVRKDHGHVDVDVRVGHVGTSSVRLDHDVLLPDGTVAATGSTVLVAWDMQARGKRAITDDERAKLGV